MINHARTIIFNMPASPSSALDEYVPPTFQALSAIGPVIELHKLLLPSGEVRDMRNFYTDQLLTIMHTPDLVRFVSTFDSRLTYTELLAKYRTAGTWPVYPVTALFTSSEARAKQLAQSMIASSFYVSDVSEFVDVVNTTPSDYVKLGAIGHILAYGLQYTREYGTRR